MSWTENHHAIRARANELVDLINIRTPEELANSLDEIAAFRGAVVRVARMEGVDGRLVRNGRRGIITVSSTHSHVRRRFSVAHELGHFELHEGVDQAFACTGRNMKEYRRSGVEREANYFAANLLMPDALFGPLAEEPPPSVALIKHLAGRFDTSLTSTAIRLVEMSIHRCALVMADDAGVQWSVVSDDFGLAIDRRNPKLSPYSYAYDALHAGTTQDRPSNVDADTWLYFDDLRDGSHLMESSMALGNYGVALSILWLKPGR